VKSARIEVHFRMKSSFIIIAVLVSCFFVEGAFTKTRKSYGRGMRREKRVTPRPYSNGAYREKHEDVEQARYSTSSIEDETASSDRIMEESSLEDALSEPIQVMCEINGYMVPAVIDTGAQVSVMSSSCAKRCHVSHEVDTRFSGKAVGVGSTDVLGRINDIPLRVGPLNFKTKIAVLRETAGVDFLLGRDFLRRFRSDICMRSNMLTMHVRDKVVRLPLMSHRPQRLGDDSMEFMPVTSTPITTSHEGSEPWMDEAPTSAPTDFATLNEFPHDYFSVDEKQDFGEPVSMEGV